MKKFVIPLLLILHIIVGCSKENVINESEVDSSSQELILTVSKENPSDLQIAGSCGLKSSAEQFTSTVSVGDTLIWTVDSVGYINNITGIIIVSSDCDSSSVFENNIEFSGDSTSCYGVISEDAYGTIKYDIEFKTSDGAVVRVDPDIIVSEPTDLFETM